MWELKKILQITPVYFPSIGGIEDVVRSLTAGVIESGWSCDVADVRTSYSSPSRDRIDSSNVYRVPLYGHRLIGVAPSLRKLVAKYDLIHVHDPQLAALSMNGYVWSGRKPMVLSTHGGYFHTPRHSLLKMVHSRMTAPWIANAYDRILASSESDSARFATISGRVSCVANGVNVERFADVGPSAEQNYLSWIYWGRFSTNKRIDLVIRYAGYARSRGFPVRLRICGSDFDNIRGFLLELIEKNGLSGCVDIISAPTDQQLLSLIRESTIFVTASEFEGFGLSVIEAMAAGLPVICRNIQPLSGFLKSGLQGITLSFDESDGDLASLIRFISLPSDAYRRGSALNRTAASAYSWKVAIDGFVDVYKRLLQ
jgi:alpha-1,3-mannosyltransferase